MYGNVGGVPMHHWTTESHENERALQYRKKSGFRNPKGMNIHTYFINIRTRRLESNFDKCRDHG